jgi:hypothetical protein
LGRTELVVKFDEITLSCVLRYPGEPLQLGAAAVDVAALLDTDDEEVIEAGMRHVSAAMVTRLADRVRAVAEGGGTAALTLAFEH